MTQYEAIAKRVSVRKFQMKPVDERTMAQLNTFIKTLTPLHAQAAYRLAIVENFTGAGSEKRRTLPDAPYYIALSAKEHPFAAVNAGYVMEQIVLYLTSKGLGSCYFSDVKEIKSADNYKTLIAVAFGRPFYAVQTEHRRRSADSLTIFHEAANEDAKRILEAACLAPSHNNLQPWRFEAYAGRIHVFMRKRLLVNSSRLRTLDLIGVGAAILHMAAAAEELWLDSTFVQTEAAKLPEKKKCTYITTFAVNKKEF